MTTLKLSNDEIKEFMNWLVDNNYLTEKTITKTFNIYYQQYIRDKRITQLGI